MGKFIISKKVYEVKLFDVDYDTRYILTDEIGCDVISLPGGKVLILVSNDEFDNVYRQGENMHKMIYEVEKLLEEKKIAYNSYE